MRPLRLCAVGIVLTAFPSSTVSAADPAAEHATVQALEPPPADLQDTAIASAVVAADDANLHLQKLAAELVATDAPAAAPVGVRSAPSQAISVPQGAGKIEGMGESFGAELSTGVATFRVPIVLPAARGTAQPSLALEYSSASGVGLAGAGWTLGVGFIARQTDRGVPLYQDPAPGGAWTPAQDRFVFGGGQELVPICSVQGASCAGAQPGEVMPAWASGWQYFRARVEGDFLRFFWSPDHRTWRVQSKSGVSLELGAPLDASDDGGGLESAPGDPRKIYRWNLVRQYDAQGPGDPAASTVPHPANLVTYRWTSVGGVAYLTDVYDTPPASAAGASGAPSVDSYAHHARVLYETRPDVTRSHRRGYRVTSSVRITGVDVTSKPFGGGPGAPRELLRRYHFSYDGAYHVSLLTRVQEEGRCASAIAEDSTGALPTTSCPALPAMAFDYQHVAGASDLPGFEPLVDTWRAFASSPPFSLGEGSTALVDVDADSLPDLLVTSPASAGPGHQIFVNGVGGAADAFGPATPMGVDGSLGADGTVIALGNRHLAVLDVDGDGIADLFHMPVNLQQSVYSAQRVFGAWQWTARAIATPASAAQPIDFGDTRVRVADVDGDGLVDIVRSTGSSYLTLFSLGRFPGGDGVYGTATWTGATTAALSNQPAAACMPWAGTPVGLDDDGVRLADMNGDGLVDLVRVRFGDVKYWPGDGRGRFGLDLYDASGAPIPCPADSFADHRYVDMAGAPHIPGLQGAQLRLDDVNGDGLDDLVRVRTDAVDIWLNVDGAGWTDRHVIALPRPLVSTGRVQLLDVDGSGTPDIVVGEAGDYRYIDLLGGQRPWLLTSASNGLGRTTQIEYATSTQMMLAAAAGGQPWASTAPVVVHVVSRITESDGLAVAGRAPGTTVTEYAYRDPLFDGRQREMRGFSHVTVTHDGDSDTPGDITSTDLLLGACAVDPSDASGLPSPCTFAGRWRDNPREALKGLPVVEERSSVAGVYLSTAHTQYTLRKLYSGVDGRNVWQAYPARVDTWLYDSGAWVAAASTASSADVVGDSPRTITLRSTSGRVQIASTAAQDPFGEATAQGDVGCVAGCSADETITSGATPTRIPEGSGWMYRKAETWVQGKDGVRRRWIKTSYDGHGNPVTTKGELTGSLPLVRFHETPGAAVAPAPVPASVDGEIVLGGVTYDAFGNPTRQTGPGGHCHDVIYDADFAQLVVGDATHAGAVDPSTGCGTTLLMINATYDRGNAAATDVFGVDGAQTHAEYDWFGRVVALTRPDPTTGALASVPSVLVDYDLPVDPVARPYSFVHTRTQDGPDTATASYREVWAAIDGFGRAVVSFAQADPSAGDGGQWVVQGLTDRDAKGAARRVFLPWFWTGDPHAFPLATPPPTSFGRTRYDAFGRVFETYTYDGSIASRLVPHAVSADLYDAADLQVGGAHYGTPASEYKDGHGRTIQRTDRLHSGGQIVAQSVQVAYLPSGEPRAITRVQSGQPAVTRWMGYDTLGRMVLNVDANTSTGYVAPYASPVKNLPATLHAWRYAYDDAGRVVGTSDARGCGVNTTYDAAGRRVAEDYSPCRADHAPYSAPDLGTGDGTEVLYRYDAIDPDASSVVTQEPGFAFDSGAYLGRVASVTDRGAKSIPAYDRRGRDVGSARRIALPGAASDVLAQRFAPRWYVQTTGYDAADRPVVASTGVRSPELMAGGSSAVQTQYTKRGTVASVGSSYGTLVAGTTHGADGLIAEERWGDAAATTTDYTYDARRRLASVMTYRAKAPLWSSPNATYSAPDASTTQLLLEDGVFSYDAVDNAVSIADLRTAAEWPAGALPVSRAMQYDDLYRLTRVDSTYAGGDDAWSSPFAAEDSGGPLDSRRATPSPHVAFDERPRWQTFAYDSVGNTQQVADDASGFYDRSLGAITNGGAADGAYQLRSATGATSPRAGSLTAAYDSTGNLISLAVARQGPCLPAGATCGQRFAYGWDEVGRLVRARRWDEASPGAATDPVPSATPSAELRYAYDASDERVLKTAVDAQGNTRFAAYIFASLELRGAAFDETDYERTVWTEVAYLFANEFRLARLHYGGPDLPRPQGGALHVLLELSDHLGSTDIVIDHDSGELVERGTYQAYGAIESDYRPARWDSFREDYRFTGKEEDVEIGLQYFGKRFYAPALTRWASPDPLAVHAPGQADLNLYAYVHGRVFGATDPRGLDDHSEDLAHGGCKVGYYPIAPAPSSDDGPVPYDPKYQQPNIYIGAGDGGYGPAWSASGDEGAKRGHEDHAAAATADPDALKKIAAGGACMVWTRACFFLVTSQAKNHDEATVAIVNYEVGEIFSGGRGGGNVEPRAPAPVDPPPPPDVVAKLLAKPKPKALPGPAGVPIPGRPAFSDLAELTKMYEVEFAVTYRLGPGTNGGGGQYFLFSGTNRSVAAALDDETMLICHTHPRPSSASPADMSMMDGLQTKGPLGYGSPQRSSIIIPGGGASPFRFNRDYPRLPQGVKRDP